jgi:hypothetical protein
MQASLSFPEDHAVKSTERELLDALKQAVANISIKELAYRLDVSPSLIADALAERANKGVRASWLVTIIEMANTADATAILSVLAHRKRLDVVPRKELTAEEKAERLEEKLRSLGATGLRLIRKALGDR